MRFKQCVGLLLAITNAMNLKVGDLHLHSKTVAAPINKDIPEFTYHAVAPIEVWVEDSLQYELAKPKSLVWQPMWSR